MKTAFLTFHDSTNYGAALQTVATYKILSRYSHCSAVDYHNPVISHQGKLIRIDRYGFKRIAHDAARIVPRYQAISRFRRFAQEHLTFTEKVQTKSHLEAVLKQFKVVFAGSDQVWNPQCQTESDIIDTAYFLDVKGNFVKASYASSFGGYTFDNSQTSQVSRMLASFDHLSVRESDAALYLKELINRDATHVVDPTLLLTKEEWMVMAKSAKQTLPKKFILTYQMNNNSLNKLAIDYIKNATGIDDVVVIDQGLLKKYPGSLQLRNLGPAEFLDLFNRADYIVTDSFHGCCFSVNFGKRFLAVKPPKRPNRIVSLFSELKMQEQLLTTEYEIGKKQFEYDYAAAQVRIEGLRTRSMGYISKVLESVN